VISIDADDSGRVADRAAHTMAELEEKFRKKEFKKRSLGTIPFQVGTDIAFNVGVYCTLRKATRDYPRALDAKVRGSLHQSSFASLDVSSHPSNYRVDVMTK
jgi:hypothetical protein